MVQAQVCIQHALHALLKMHQFLVNMHPGAFNKSWPSCFESSAYVHVLGYVLNFPCCMNPLSLFFYVFTPAHALLKCCDYQGGYFLRTEKIEKYM